MNTLYNNIIDTEIIQGNEVIIVPINHFDKAWEPQQGRGIEGERPPALLGCEWGGR